ncbi:MAG: ATP-binding protein [Patescibacteria group bacterium]
MPTLYIMCGVGFSGKSTLAKGIAAHFHIPLVSQDAMYFEKQAALEIDQDSDEEWRMLLGMCLQRIKELLQSGKSVVFDNVNLRKEHRDELRTLANEVGAQTVVVYLDTPEKTLLERQEKNKETGERHEVKQEYLDDAKAQLEIPRQDENAFIFAPESDLKEFLERLPH